MPITNETIIRILTAGSLAGLLFAVGLRLTIREVIDSVRRCRLILIVVANFVAVPVLVVSLARGFQLDPNLTIGMIILAAAPFAPVVPVFAKMARADLALAAGLTTLFPLLSIFATPFVCELALRAVPGAGTVQFNVSAMLLTLLGTIALPLGAGMVVHQLAPTIALRVLRPLEIFSEGGGAISLAFVTFVEIHSIIGTGWWPLLVMILSSELCFVMGYLVAGGNTGSRRVVALGTANRNIALGILVAIQNFPGTPVIAAVAANGLLLILLGLVHVAFWRFWRDRPPAT